MNVTTPKVVEALLGVQFSGRSFGRPPIVGGSRNTLAIDSDGQVRSQEGVSFGVHAWAQLHGMRLRPMHVKLGCVCTHSPWQLRHTIIWPAMKPLQLHVACSSASMHMCCTRSTPVHIGLAIICHVPCSASLVQSAIHLSSIYNPAHLFPKQHAHGT